MLKQAFRFLGIGFFLSGLILFGLTRLNLLTPNSMTEEKNVVQESTSVVVTKVETSKRQSSESTTETTTAISTTAATETETSTSSQGESTTQEKGKFVIAEGDDSYTVAIKLKDTGYITNVEEFVGYLSSNKLDTLLQNGTFTIPANVSIEDLGKILTTYPGN